MIIENYCNLSEWLNEIIITTIIIIITINIVHEKINQQCKEDLVLQ